MADIASEQENLRRKKLGSIGITVMDNPGTVTSSGETVRPKSEFEQVLEGIPDAPKMDLTELIEKRKAGLGGFSSEESNAQRAQMALNLGRQQEASRRQLLAAQARSGVRGGAAVAQQSRFAQQGMAQRAQGEQQLFVQNIAEQQRRLKEYEDLQKSQQFGNLASQLTRWQLAQAELQKRAQIQAAQIAAQAQVQAAKEG